MTETLRLFEDRVDTPIGELLVVVDAAGRLRAMGWADRAEILLAGLRRRLPAGFTLSPVRDPSGVTSALAAYFAGDLGRIETLAVDSGGTAFQQAVWTALRAIPCGQTLSYAELARRIGYPQAVRAVGLANGANPVPVVVPCHRVIGSNGRLTGYAGGIERKRWLLAHESSGSGLLPGLRA